jgi:hypothetical protein
VSNGPPGGTAAGGNAAGGAAAGGNAAGGTALGGTAAAGRVELRTRRLAWRLCAALWPRRSTSPAPRLSSARALAFSLLATLAVVLGAAPLLGPAALFAAPAVLLGVLLVRALVLFGSIAWYATGAGQPVLVLDGGRVLGRLRPAWADLPRAGPAGGPDWWDLRLPVGQLRGVRVARPDGPARRRMLALDLPPDAAAGLSRSPGLSELTRRLERSAGSPAGWSAGAMLPVGRRGRDLAALVAALERARTDHTRSGAPGDQPPG